MTAEEFNYEFDLLYNNISNNNAPGLDAYEKSVFLTLALDEILKAYASPKSNKLQEGIDDSERRYIDFSNLILVDTITENLNKKGSLWPEAYAIPTTLDSIYLILNELLLVTRKIGTTTLTNYKLQVIPLAYTEYTQIQSRGDFRPPKNLAYRMFSTLNKESSESLSTKSTKNKSLSVSIELLLGRNDVPTSYTIRYLKKPYPIILENLEPLGLSIDGKNSYLDINNPCELDPIIHKEILQRAVELAKASYVSTELGTTLALGLLSQTPIGMITSNK